MTEMRTPKNCYQKSLMVLKQNFIRAIVVTLFLVSLVVLFYVLEQGMAIAFDWDFRNWWESQQTTLTLLAAVIFCGALIVFLLFPLLLGAKRWFFDISQDDQKPLAVLLFYFENGLRYRQAISLQLQLFLREALMYLICLLPGIVLQEFVVQSSSYASIAMGVLYGVLIALSIFSMIIGCCFAFYSNLNYFLVSYFHFQHPELRPSEAIRESVLFMKRRRSEVTSLYMSLFPFYLLCVFVLPLVLLVPYMQVLAAAKGREYLEKLHP